MLSSIGQYDYFNSESGDIKAVFEKDEDRFAPSNIANILAKTAVALGSDDNVSVVVGVKTSVYRK